MSTITYCDKCNKKQGSASEGWISLSLNNVNLEPQGLDNYYNNFKFCPSCGKVVVPKIIKLLKNK